MAAAEIADHHYDGHMKSKEDTVAGINTFPETLLELSKGERFGKLGLPVTADLHSNCYDLYLHNHVR